MKGISYRYKRKAYPMKTQGRIKNPMDEEILWVAQRWNAPKLKFSKFIDFVKQIIDIGVIFTVIQIWPHILLLDLYFHYG